MDMDEIQAHGCKFPRIGNNNRTEGRRMEQNGEDEEEEDCVVDRRREALNGSGSGGGGGGGGGHNIGVSGRFCGWPSSRIVRVSRASGGKDRHSKVLTFRGLRDRRIRLSVLTAIQFYDLQDRLGLDQPSKAVEWLLKAAATSIDELPPIKASLPETPKKQLSDERRSSPGSEHEHGFDSHVLEIDGDPSYHQPRHQTQQQNVSLSKSACSSTSETSKGSGLSLSRSESRIKARERARGRAAEKEKEKECDSHLSNSFTELLTAGINNVSSSPSGSNQAGGGSGEANFFHKNRHWSSTGRTTEECFTNVLYNRHSSSSSGFASSGRTHLPTISQFINVTGGEQQHPPELQLQNFSVIPDHLSIPIAHGTGAGNESDYNLNFSISNLGFNRGTLQSNSPSTLTMPHLQRMSPLEASNPSFFINSAGQMTAPVENHHQQFPSSLLDDRLHLYYRDPNQKGKGRKS